MSLQYRQLLEPMFNVTTTGPFWSTTHCKRVNDVSNLHSPMLWSMKRRGSAECGSLQQDRLLQLVNGVEVPALVDSLLQSLQMM